MMISNSSLKKQIPSSQIPGSSSIEILVSTLNDGLYKINMAEHFNYVILHQVTNGNYDIYKEYFTKNKSNKVRYIQSDSIGLSNSRNILIEESVADYIWFMDDDVEIHSDAYSRLDHLITNNDFDGYILNHSSSVEIKNNFKIERKLNKFNCFHVSSIDILIKRTVVVDNVRFDSHFGLGTSRPSGEEYIFISDIIKKGGRILQTKLVVSYHPPLASGNDYYSTREKVLAKKEMFTRVFGFFGIFGLILFILKKSPELHENNRLTYFIMNCFR